MHRHEWTSRVVFSLSALVLTSALFGVPTRSLAEDGQPPAAVTYKNGTVTGIYETTFQIDHRTYSLTPDAVLLDRHGDPLEPKDLKVDIEVKYHLQKGSTDKIDQMILFLPL
jgi:hypothetical protein